MIEQAKKILVIVGPTATGKTDLALDLAKKYQGELVSCDSRQVYRGLDLITGKLPKAKKIVKHQGYWEVDGVRIWMVDVAEPKNSYSVFDYISGGREVLTDIWNRQKLPVIVGGTGYYLQGLLEGFANVGVPVNAGLRRELANLETSQLQEKIATLSPEKWRQLNNSDRNNPARLIRAIEIEGYRKTVGKIAEGTPLLLEKIEILKIGLDAPIDVLKRSIIKRLEQRIIDGMIDEAKRLVGEGLSVERMEALGLECRYLARFLEGKLSLDEMKVELAVKIGQYAKRQRTWFRADKDIHWFDVDESGWKSKVEKTVADWYN